MPMIREPFESCVNSSNINCNSGSSSSGLNPPNQQQLIAMAKDEQYNEDSLDELALSMKNNLKLKASVPSSSSYLSKKHRLSPYSMQENQQNRSKSSCVSLDGIVGGTNGSVQQYCSSSGSDGHGQSSDQDVGTCRLLREGSLIKEAVKRLQSKRRPFPF